MNMNIRRNILVMLILLGAMVSSVSAQDYLNIVCAGDTGVDYSVKGTEGSTFDWTVEGGTIARNYNDSIIVSWGDVPGVHTIRVQEISQYGCYSEPVEAKVLVSAPDIRLPEDASICEGDVYTVEPEGNYYSYEWNDGSTGSSYSTSEEGWITCRVSNQYGCYWQDEMYLEVRDLPFVDLGRDTSLCGEQSLYLDAGTDGIDYQWSTGEKSQQIQVFQGQKEIWVNVEDEFGCRNSDTIMINNCDPGVFFRDIPTAFTPNGDGRNDVWRIKELEAYPQAVVDIYDRWGRLIYRSEPGYPEPWDGRNARGEIVPMDSYHFVILLNFGEDDRITGSVTVIR